MNASWLLAPVMSYTLAPQYLPSHAAIGVTVTSQRCPEEMAANCKHVVYNVRLYDVVRLGEGRICWPELLEVKRCGWVGASERMNAVAMRVVHHGSRVEGVVLVEQRLYWSRPRRGKG